MAGIQKSQVYLMNYILNVLVLTLGLFELLAGFGGVEGGRALEGGCEDWGFSAVAMGRSYL